MEYNYYFDSKGIFTHKLPATTGTFPPDNTLRIPPPVCQDKEIPILNETKNGWTLTQDHRQKKDELDRIIEGSGTAYWLPEDKYDSEPRYMTEIGELPKNALLIKPEKTQEEKDLENIAHIKSQLTLLDSKSARPLRAIVAGTATDSDRQAVQEAENEAQILREELQILLIKYPENNN